MKKYVDKSKAPKRTKDQIIRDRTRVAELVLQGYSHQDIADILRKETGITLSRRTISADIAIIRKDWIKERRDNYDLLVTQELARCDSTEKELWRAWRASCNGSERKMVEEVAKQFSDASEDIELVVNKVTTIMDTHSGVGDPRFLDKIISVQKERRRLLGLYAPARLGIDIRQKNELIIKGYAVKDASPDVWPELETGEENIIEGDYSSDS
jgi:hypothetical protein